MCEYSELLFFLLDVFFVFIVYLYDVFIIFFGVVDLKGDEIFFFDVGVLFVVDAYVFSFKVELEEFVFGYGYFYLGRFVGYFCIDNVI